MSDYSSKSVCVIDNGLFADMAATLARSFGRVYLKTPWERTAPVSTERRVGEGLKDVEVIDSLWPYVEKCDLFVFTDLNYGDLQEYLAEQGKRVWGARSAEMIETDRILSRKILKKAGIKVPPYTVVKGVAALRDHLKDHPDRFVKIPFTRGDAETFRAESYELVEPRIDELEFHLGPEKHSMQFVVETPIEDAIELGYDGYCIDGEWPYNRGEQGRLGYLRLDEGGAHGQHRLTCEKRRTLRNREQVSGKPEISEVIEESAGDARELRQPAQIIDLLRGKAQVKQKLDALRQAGGNDEVAVPGKPPDGKLEGGFVGGLASFEIAGGHSQFVEVGEESGHVSGSGSCRFCASYFLAFFGGWNSFTSPAAFWRSSAALASSS